MRHLVAILCLVASLAKAETVEFVRDLDGRGQYICLQGRNLFLLTGADAKPPRPGCWFEIEKDPAAPTLVSRTLPGGWDIALAGQYAVLCDYTRDLKICDTRDRGWKEVGRAKMPSLTENVIVRNGLAFVATHMGGLTIVNIADAAKPAIVGSLNPKIDCDAIALAGETAILYAHWESRLVMVDVKDPANPTRIGVYQHDGGFNQGEMDYADGFAFCTGKTLVIVDVRDPARAKLAASVDFKGVVHDVVVKDGYAFVAVGGQGIHVLNVKDPTRPVELGAYRSPDLHALQLAVSHNAAFHIYVANGKGPAKVLRFGERKAYQPSK